LQILFAVEDSLRYGEKIGIKTSSDPPIIGLSGGHNGEEGQEEGEEVLTDVRHIRLSR
jgi:hypothetical protein